MKPAPAAASRNDFVGDLFDRSRNGRGAALVALLVALSGHAMASTLASHVEAPRLPVPPPLELEFVAPPPPPEPVVPEPPAPEPPAAEPTAAPIKAAAPRAPAPAAAAAPNVLTAKPTAAAPDPGSELLDFTSDPNATGQSFGVVALGGTGHKGQQGAVVRPGPALPSVARPTGSGDGLTPLGDLSRRPELGADDPCRGFFPSSALDNSAKATVLLVIRNDGSVKTASLVSESPPGQGFGTAAQACMKKQRFSPALDRGGRQVSTAMRVNVRFKR